MSIRKKQYLFGISAIIFLSGGCFLFREYVHYHIVALVLLLAVSIQAILYDILPVLVSAVLSAVILNIFFIDPVFHYKINNLENLLLFFIYLFIALVSAVLTNKIKKQEKKIRDEEKKENIIRLYNTLLNSLSHELRTPIATIIGSIDTLKDEELNIPENARRELLTEIEIAGVRLNQQVGNLLNMSRLESGFLELKKDWCDVNELVFMVLQKFEKHNQRLVQFIPVDNLPFFKIDAGLMEQVIYGLVQNALTYTRSGSEIIVEAGISEDRLIIKVIDNGDGIPDIEKERIFKKFYRMPNSRTGGSGLGLSIVKGIAQAHGGTVELEDTLSGGATFIVVIPAEITYINSLKNE